jgi:hypothetical protein
MSLAVDSRNKALAGFIFSHGLSRQRASRIVMDSQHFRDADSEKAAPDSPVEVPLAF